MRFNQEDVVFLPSAEHVARHAKGMKPTLFYCKSQMRKNKAPVYTLLKTEIEKTETENGLPGKKIHWVIVDPNAPPQAAYSNKVRFNIPGSSEELSEEPSSPTQLSNITVSSPAVPTVSAVEPDSDKVPESVSTFRKIIGFTLMGIGAVLCGVSYASSVTGFWPFSLIGAEAGKVLMATGAACFGLGSMKEMYEYLFCGCLEGGTPKAKVQPKKEESSASPGPPFDEFDEENPRFSPSSSLSSSANVTRAMPMPVVSHFNSVSSSSSSSVVQPTNRPSLGVMDEFKRIPVSTTLESPSPSSVSSQASSAQYSRSPISSVGGSPSKVSATQFSPTGNRKTYHRSFTLVPSEGGGQRVVVVK